MTQVSHSFSTGLGCDGHGQWDWRTRNWGYRTALTDCRVTAIFFPLLELQGYSDERTRNWGYRTALTDCRVTVIFFPFLELQGYSDERTRVTEDTDQKMVCLNYNPVWFLCTFLVTHFKPTLKLNGDKTSPFRPFGWGNSSENSTVQSVQRRATGLTAGIRFPSGVKDFSLLPSVQAGSGAHPASYSMGTGASVSEWKAAGAWSWPLTSS
jgi:hypothetical protein